MLRFCSSPFSIKVECLLRLSFLWHCSAHSIRHMMSDILQGVFMLRIYKGLGRPRKVGSVPAFTLLEIVVSLFIVVLLASVAVPTYNRFIANSASTVLEQESNALGRAAASMAGIDGFLSTSHVHEAAVETHGRFSDVVFSLPESTPDPEVLYTAQNGPSSVVYVMSASHLGEVFSVVGVVTGMQVFTSIMDLSEFGAIDSDWSAVDWPAVFLAVYEEFVLANEGFTSEPPGQEEGDGGQEPVHTEFGGLYFTSYTGMDIYNNLPSGENFVKVAGAESHAIALLNDGSVYTWGDSGFGVLDVPADLCSTSDGVVVDVASGGASWGGSSYPSFSAVLCADGTLETWGGEDSDIYPLPAEICDGSAIESIHGSLRNLAVLCENSTMQAWGNNTNGQLGIPAEIQGSISVLYPGLHSYAVILDDASVVSWGQMGSVPAELNNENVVSLGVSNRSAIMLRSDGTWDIWGSFSDGTLLADEAPDSEILFSHVGAGYGYMFAYEQGTGNFMDWGSWGETSDPAYEPNLDAGWSGVPMAVFELGTSGNLDDLIFYGGGLSYGSFAIIAE